jgi:putative phosphoribosyl transferase
MERYQNRYAAGKTLADLLKSYANRKDVLVLGLPRGGVPVAYEIAKSLYLPLDVFIVRKLGVPGHEELAMGALAMGDTKVFNKEIMASLDISKEAIDDVIHMERKELQRREIAYRGHKTFPIIKNKTIILVDDGVATGASIKVAIKALRQLEPAAIVLAIPVAEANICKKLTSMVEKFVCPMQPINFYAVGQWYEDFSQTTDEEVYALLKKN